MRLENGRRTAAFAACCGIWLATIAARADEGMEVIVPIAYQSGRGAKPSAEPADANAVEFLADRHTIQVDGAGWIQLLFGPVELGRASYLSLRSPLDGGTQRLDATSIEQWRHRSAYFNGDRVEISLWRSVLDSTTSYAITGASIGDGEHAVAHKSICDSSDERLPSSDPAVGRLRAPGNTFCSVFIVSNGALLSAGHCKNAFLATGSVVEFNAPASNCNGTVVFAQPDDQYAISWINARIVIETDGSIRPGEDYAEVAVFPNSNTGLMPAQKQNAFYRIWPYVEYAEPSMVRVSGYGIDSDPVGCTGAGNAGNNAQQTDTGSFLGRFSHPGSAYTVRHRVDTTSGQSGAPVIQTSGFFSGFNVAIGIHTEQGCDDDSESFNLGTAMLTDGIRTRLQRYYIDLNNLPQTTVMVYVDQELRGALLNDGRIYDPFETMQQAVVDAPDNAIVSVVPGDYSAALTIDRPLTIVAPVGRVTVGAAP
jgi:hypothetical protein